MTQVKLKGKTQKGKNRVREQGEVWNLLRVDPQRGALIESTRDSNHVRWVHSPIHDGLLDKDFEVTEI